MVAFCSSALVCNDALLEGTRALVVVEGMAWVGICSALALPISYPLWGEIDERGERGSGGRSHGVAGGESLTEDATTGEAENLLRETVGVVGRFCVCTGSEECLGGITPVLVGDRGEPRPDRKGLEVLT